MITPIDYRIQCDNRDACAARRRYGHPAGGYAYEGDWQSLAALTPAYARDLAEQQGWRRVTPSTGGPMVDLCPECAAKRAES